MSREEIERRLALLSALEISPREKAVYKTLAARADAWYARLLGEERNYLGQLIDALGMAMDVEDSSELDEVTKAMTAYLDSLDG